MEVSNFGLWRKYIFDDHSLEEEPVELPSFHLFGEKDKRLKESKIVASYWDSSQQVTYTHDRGHEIDTLMWTRETETMKSLNLFLDKHLLSTQEHEDQNLDSIVRMQLKDLDLILEQMQHKDKLELRSILQGYQQQHGTFRCATESPWQSHQS